MAFVIQVNVHNPYEQTLHTEEPTTLCVCVADELMLLVLEEDMDVFELVVEAMKAFPHSEELQFQGCSALSMLLQRGFIHTQCCLIIHHY